MIVVGTIVTTLVEIAEVDLGDQDIPEGELGEMFMKVAMTLSHRKTVGKNVQFGVIAKLTEDHPNSGAPIASREPAQTNATQPAGSQTSYCALCDAEHRLHEDAQGFHHVIKGERVACPSAQSKETT